MLAANFKKQNLDNYMTIIKIFYKIKEQKLPLGIAKANPPLPPQKN